MSTMIDLPKKNLRKSSTSKLLLLDIQPLFRWENLKGGGEIII